MSTLLTVLVVVALALCGACAALSWVFVVRHARTRWRATPEGRYLMWSKIAMALLFTFTLLGQVLPVPPIVAVLVAVVLFGWTAVVLADLVHLQTLAHRSARAARAVQAEQDRMTRDRVARLRRLDDEPPAG